MTTEFDYLPIGTMIEVVDTTLTVNVNIGDTAEIRSHETQYTENEAYGVVLKTGRVGLSQTIIRQHIRVI